MDCWFLLALLIEDLYGKEGRIKQEITFLRLTSVFPSSLMIKNLLFLLIDELSNELENGQRKLVLSPLIFTYHRNVKTEKSIIGGWRGNPN
jgi:hypothetical protein